MPYVDGFFVPVPKNKVEAYRRLAQKAGRVAKARSAGVRECIGDDLRVTMGVPFTRAARLKPGETGMFSWIVYKSRVHCDRVNANVMKDPQLAAQIDPKTMPFDVKRMVYGGFRTIVEL